MPKFQVTSRELVYIDRTYEVEADDLDAAKHEAKERRGEMIDEQVGDTWDFVRILDAEEIASEVGLPSIDDVRGILNDQ